ncbi:MAG: response regulator [Desulfobacteraceae bacterium]|jgi:PAS domain S-box-containing protein
MEKTKILSFDAEHYLHKIFENYLSGKDFSIRTCDSSKDLSELLKLQDYDLVFLNLSPNHPDQIQRLNRLKKSHPDGTFVLAIDQTLDETTKKRLKNVIFDYLEKPISSESFFKVFYNALHYRHYLKKKDFFSIRLRESQERYHRIIKNIDEGYFEADISGRITFANESMEKIFEIDKENLAGAKSKDLFASSVSHKIDRFFNQIHKDGRPQKYRGSLLLKSGREIHIAASISLFHHKSQQKGFIGVICDLTAQNIAEKEKSQLESQLQQSQKMEAIGTLAGGIAHDFNNILSAIIGYAELSLQDLPISSRFHNNLKQMLNAGERARDLVRQILTFSRQTEKDFAPISVRPIIKEALKLLKASLPATIDIQTQIDSDATVLADPTQIHQVLINLCTNAGFAMQEHGGKLEILLTNVNLNADFCYQHPELTPGMHLHLKVSDTGVGIPPDYIKRIFEPFFTTKERGKGTGMGLALVHGIVKNHNGTVLVTSQLGQGTTFDIYIPIVSLNAQPVSSRVMGSIPTGDGRILFVDDEIVQKDLAKKMLERLGYRVTTYDCAQTALSLFQHNPHQFDLVITDMTMPRMTGDIFARKIMHLRPDIPIIICTGYSEKMNEEKALSMGIKGFMMKPFSMHTMGTLIHNILSPI